MCRSSDFVLCCIVHVGEKGIAAMTASDILMVLKYFALTHFVYMYVGYASIAPHMYHAVFM